MNKDGKCKYCKSGCKSCDARKLDRVTNGLAKMVGMDDCGFSGCGADGEGCVHLSYSQLRERVKKELTKRKFVEKLLKMD